MISTHEGRNKGGIWLKLNWIDFQMVSPDTRYCNDLSTILTDITITRSNVDELFPKDLNFAKRSNWLYMAWEKGRCQAYAKKSLIKMIYNNYFSCLTCIKDNFIMNKHYFTFGCVRSRTINALLA